MTRGSVCFIVELLDEEPVAKFVRKRVLIGNLAVETAYSYNETSLCLSHPPLPRLRSSDRRESPGDDRREWLSRIPVPRLRRSERAGSVCERSTPRASGVRRGTSISGSEKPDEMPRLMIRRRDPNSMQLCPLAV